MIPSNGMPMLSSMHGTRTNNMDDHPPAFASIFQQRATSKRAPGQVFGNNRLVGPRGEGSGIALYWDIECMHCGKVRAIRKDAISNLRKQNGCGCQRNALLVAVKGTKER